MNLIRLTSAFQPVFRARLLRIVVLVMIIAPGSALAQDCDAIVLPFLNNDVQRLNQYPAHKMAYRCAFSQFSFEVADDVASGAPLHEISEVVDRFTGSNIPSDIKIDLNTLSYYQYDFNRFQGLHAEGPIYFHTPSSEHPYLVLVSFREAAERATKKMAQLGY